MEKEENKRKRCLESLRALNQRRERGERMRQIEGGESKWMGRGSGDRKRVRGGNGPLLVVR